MPDLQSNSDDRLLLCKRLCGSSDCCHSDVGTAFQAQAYNIIKSVDPYHATIGACNCAETWTFFDVPSCSQGDAGAPCPAVSHSCTSAGVSVPALRGAARITAIQRRPRWPAAGKQ